MARIASDHQLTWKEHDLLAARLGPQSIGTDRRCSGAVRRSFDDQARPCPSRGHSKALQALIKRLHVPIVVLKSRRHSVQRVPVELVMLRTFITIRFGGCSEEYIHALPFRV